MRFRYAISATLVACLTASASKAQDNPASHNFGNTPLQGTPAAQTLTYRFPSRSVAPRFTLRYGSEFSVATPVCDGPPVTACAVTVSFAPQTPGLRGDGLSVVDASQQVFARTLLYGLGVAPQLTTASLWMQTAAGTGSWGYSGDNGLASQASLASPQGVSLDMAGNLYVADTENHRIRRIDRQTLIIRTVAGNGTDGFSGDGGPAEQAQLSSPAGLCLDGLGNLYIADFGNDRIRKVDSRTGIITTVAGGGTQPGTDGFGDGAQALDAHLFGPTGVFADAGGNLLIADCYHHLIRRVDTQTGRITVFAGGGTTATGTDALGDGGPAGNAVLNYPQGVAADAQGNVYIADTGNNLIRQVSLASGLITVVAGNGADGYSGDGGSATNAAVGNPYSVAVDVAGNVYFADFEFHVVRRVSPVAHTITTVIGKGTAGFSGDAAPAGNAELNSPSSLALGAAGEIYVADYGNNRIRAASPFSPAVQFADTPAGQASAPQFLDVSNQGTAPLTLTGISAAAPFVLQSLGSGCSGSMIASGATCRLSLLFRPTSPGTVTGSLTLVSNSLNQPNAQATVSLQGNGTPPTPVSLTIGANLAGTAFSVSGSGCPIGSYVVPMTFSLTPGLTCVFTMADVQSYLFQGWDDQSAANPRTIVIPSGVAAYTVTAQYQLRPACSFSLSAAVPSVPASAFAGTVSVTAAAGCAWSAVSNAPSWLSVVSGANGAGSGILTFEASANTTGSPRSGTLTIAGQTVTVSQAASPSSDGNALRFVPVTPCRIVDTRLPADAFGGPTLWGGISRDFILPQSSCQIPATAKAYALNVTVIPATTLSFLTIWPSGGPRPDVSTLNSYDGRVKANALIVPAGESGALSVYATDNTQFVLDLTGYFTSTDTPSALAFYPVTPCRVIDTRVEMGPLGTPSLAAQQERSFPVLQSLCGLPASAQAYSFNYTVIPKGALAYLSSWPSGQIRPVVSTLNAPTGTVTANAAILPAGTNGDVSVYVTTDTDLIVDVNGYFAPAALGGLSFYTLSPCRALDTRSLSAPSPLHGATDVDFTSVGCQVPPSAKVLSLNATVLPGNTLGFLSLWPYSEAMPNVSTLNAYDGTVTSNMAIVPSTNGRISAFTTDPAHLIFDIFGYFAP